jgi:hypothetical protein
MKIGDTVIFNDPTIGTLNGKIINVIIPKCKCKNRGYYIVDFGGFTKNIKIDDNRLTLYSIEPNKGSLEFNFI